jgi:hypothetical protein
MWKSLVLVALTASQAVAGGRSGATPYSCKTIVAGDQPVRVDARFIAPWRELATTTPVDAAWLARLRDQLGREMPALGTYERVWLQHYLLTIAKRLTFDTGGWLAWVEHHLLSAEQERAWQSARERVHALVRTTAPTAKELETLGDGNAPAVASILGAQVTERATATCGQGSLVHVAVHGGLLAFRPLRAGSTRALVSQLVAFDRDGRAHVTPIVETMEMRLGDGASAPACIVYATDDGTLKPQSFAEVREHPPFIAKAGNGLTCNGCHVDAKSVGGRDISGDELTRIDALRANQVTTMATQLWTDFGFAAQPMR